MKNRTWKGVSTEQSEKVKEVLLSHGGELDTTNNRMELTAAIKALSQLREACQVELHTDSQYLQKGITEWMISWKKRNWKKADNKPVKNADLWALFDK